MSQVSKGCKKENVTFSNVTQRRRRNMSSRISVHFSKYLGTFYFPPICFAVKPKTHTRHIHPSHRGISHGFVRLIYERHIYRHLEHARKSRKNCLENATGKKDFLSSSTLSFFHHTKGNSVAHTRRKNLCCCCIVSHVLYINSVDLVALPLRHSVWCASLLKRMKFSCENFLVYLVTLRHNSFGIQSHLDEI